jgi:16S rRNA (adenine1518-N6/adenine1519-N6)-dimethyltransferase
MTLLPPLRDVIARHGLQAKKALGQNFLLDEQLLDRIAALAGEIDGHNVIEIGPGPGGLSRAILRAGGNLLAIERDERCLPALHEIAQAFPQKLTILSGDAMQIAITDHVDGPFHIMANLPYNIGTALLIDWLTSEKWLPDWQSLTLMFQREVAERIVAKPGDKAYGRLSVLAQWRSDARLEMKVHRSAFTPPPKVMSAVVHITPKTAPKDVRSDVLQSITAAAFGQRRKMLRQSLRSVRGALEALEICNIDPQRRAETLKVDDCSCPSA